ncbi:MAG TPA: response regulator transcription factor [Oculatellaceae cyanobacterium]
MAKILLADDDTMLSDILKQWLSRQHHVVEQVYDGQSALEYIRHYKYDLIVLDWNMPGMSGPEICTISKKEKADTLVIMLTAKTTTKDKVEGFDAGADEYVTKPVDGEEFCARVTALLRRSGVSDTKKLLYKDLALTPEAGTAVRGGRQFSLPPKELELLELLMQNPTRFFSTEILLDRLWGQNASRASLANCLKRLRALLTQGGEDDLIETVSGQGYRMK